jgi:hypothetical protein
MLFKSKMILLASLCLSTVAYSQHIEEGCYNDWDYGPHGVYGNLLLTKTKERTYFKIEKSGPQTVVVKQVNPSGIVIHVASVTFVSGILSRVEKTNQWGETYEYVNYEKKGEGVFRVTDLVRGRNAFLPCKYALYVYKKDLLAEVQLYSFTGELAEDKYGVAIVQYKRYDDRIRFAEREETSFFDAQHRPVRSKAADYHKLVSQFDDHDNKISESYLGIKDEPITVRRSNVASMRFYYDGDNNMIKNEYRSIDDKITPNISGIAAAVMEYDQGYLLKETRYDSLGHTTRPLAFGDGVSIIKYEYDTAGNRIRESYFDETGKPINNYEGLHEIASFFSPGNLKTRISYFDAFGRPCVNRDSINATVFVKDDKNRIIQESSYGEYGQPVKTYTEEVYMIKRKYDHYGRDIMNSYWADSNVRMPHWDGSYGIATKYNDDGEPVEYLSLDANGEPFMTEDGSSSMKLVYNADGRLGERQFLYNDQLISNKRGVTMNYSIVKYGYDQNAKENELTFWGVNREPVNATVWIDDSVTAHRIVFIYKGNRVIEQRYYKTDALEPFQVVDCLKNDCVSLSAINIMRKNEH